MDEVSTPGLHRDRRDVLRGPRKPRQEMTTRTHMLRVLGGIRGPSNDRHG